MNVAFGIAVAVPLLLIAFTVSIYNRLVALRNRFKNAFAQIDVQLKRRYDLIPNLVETAKGYLTHERETLEAVIAARNGAASAAAGAAKKPGDKGAIRSLASAEGLLTGALGKLFALQEDYPDLKADSTIMSLMEELRATENKVAFARQAYNDAVTVFNTSREQFPNVLIAGPFNFNEAELLEIDVPEQREAPRVSFA